MSDHKRWILLLVGSNIILNYSVLAEKAKCVPGRSFRRIIDGWRLSRHIIATHNVKDNGECLKECIDNIDCKSYNYKYGEMGETKRCELNNITRKNYEHFMTSEYGFGYYEDEKVVEAPIGFYQNPGRSCEDIFEQRNNSEGNKSGEFWIWKDKSGPRKVVCSIGGVKRSILFHRRTTSDYVISEGGPDMTALTACFWVKTNQAKGLPHYISYAVPGDDNEFLMRDQYQLTASINFPERKSIRSGGKINDGKWHPICFTWSSQYGQYKFFKDGNIVDNGDGFKSGKTILGGGTWVLGQDQDVQRGGFDVNQMVQGEMTDVNIWNKVLTEREISEISANCLSQHKGNVKSWNDFIVGVRGDVKILQKPTCA